MAVTYGITPVKILVQIQNLCRDYNCNDITGLGLGVCECVCVLWFVFNAAIELMWFSFTNERERCSWLHVGLDNPICIKAINSSCCIASLQSLYGTELLIQKVF